MYKYEIIRLLSLCLFSIGKVFPDAYVSILTFKQIRPLRENLSLAAKSVLDLTRK